MTPHDDKNTLDRLWDDVPVGAPPLADLIRGGKTMRRRARLRVAGGSAALTLAVVAGSAVAANTVFDGTDPRPDGEVPAAVEPPTAPAGQRLVGVGRVVVAVPADWGTNELDGCGSPEEPTVWFPIKNTPLACSTFPYGVASVQFTTLDTDEGQQAARHATTSTEVDGIEVRRGVFACPPTADCLFSADAAPEYVVVPSEDVVITLFGPERDQYLLDAIADSVQILPESYTTVPFVEGNYPVEWNAAIAEAGLVPDGTHPECEPNAYCIDPTPPVRPDPAPGAVVPVGSTVTLFPSGPITTPVDLRGQWRLTSAELHGQAFGAPEGAHLTLVVSDAGNQAHAGCTVVWLDPQISGSSVTLRETDRGSMRSCPPDYQETDLDEPYLSAVTAIDHAMRSGEELTLAGPEVSLNFVKTG